MNSSDMEGPHDDAVGAFCRAGCVTRDHARYAECLRDASVRIAYSNSVRGQDFSKQKRWDRELGRFRDLTASGLEPSGTTHAAMDRDERAAEIRSSVGTFPVDG